MDEHLLCSTHDIPEGKAKGFKIGENGKDTFFVTRKNNQFFAYLDVCPHYNSTTLPWKRHEYTDVKGEHIVCAAHGALFDIATGVCIQGPCKHQRIQRIPIRIESNQQIWISKKTIKAFKL